MAQAVPPTSPQRKRPAEQHYADRIGWLRAAVLGANDGIVSTASLVVGVVAASTGRKEVLVAGLAGLVAGAMSMAAGEYVSVSSQADTEKADLVREQKELDHDDEFERHELAAIYEKRGLDPTLARQVADQLMAHDALGAHARDELGLTEVHSARPLQAAFASALTFAGGAALPLVIAALSPLSTMFWTVTIGSLISLAILGAISSRIGGSPPLTGSIRVTLWGALAMIATALVGKLFGVAVG